MTESKTRRYFTREEKEQVVSFCDENTDKTYATIGNILGIHELNLKRWYKEIKGYPRIRTACTRKHYSCSDKISMVEYMKNNPEESYSEIALKYNVSQKSLIRWFKEITGETRQTNTGVVNQNKGSYPEDVKLGLVKYKQDNPNSTIQQLASKFNVSTSSASNWVNKYSKQTENKIDRQKIIDILINLGVDFTVVSTNGLTELKIVLS